MIIKYETRREAWTICRHLRQLGIQATKPRRGEQRGSTKYWWEVQTVLSVSEMLWHLASPANDRLTEHKRTLTELRGAVGAIKALLRSRHGTQSEASDG